jgi:hypothetical protein
MTTSFTRMDQSTAEQWAVIGRETTRNQPRVADRVLDLLRSLGSITDGFSTDQLTHCLQTATLAEQAGADDPAGLARSLTLLLDGGLASGSLDAGVDAPEMAKRKA